MEDAVDLVMFKWLTICNYIKRSFLALSHGHSIGEKKEVSAVGARCVIMMMIMMICKCSVKETNLTTIGRTLYFLGVWYS